MYPFVEIKNNSDLNFQNGSVYVLILLILIHESFTFIISISKKGMNSVLCCTGYT